MLNVVIPQKILFNPRKISGLNLWLKADDIRLSSDSNIYLWNDLSGKGNNASQGTAANQPTVRRAILNNRPAIKIDGTNDYLNADRIADLVEGTDVPISLFVVIRPRISQDQDVIAFDDGVNGLMNFAVNPTNFKITRRDDAGVSVVVTASTYSANIWYIVYYIFYGTSIDIFVNGVKTNAAMDVGILANLLTFTIGRVRPSSSIDFDGDIAEILFYNRALNDFESYSINKYLNTKYRVY